MPPTMGTIQATRAVVEGTKKLRVKPTPMTPSSSRLLLVPTRDMIFRASLRSKPVVCMPTARNSAAATMAQAPLESPLRPVTKAAFMP